MRAIAATYEKMSSSDAAEILTQMCRNGQEQDVVKILFLTSDRATGKILSAITDRELAGRLTEKMKWVEQEG